MSGVGRAGRASWPFRVGEVWAVHAHCLAVIGMAVDPIQDLTVQIVRAMPMDQSP